MAEDIGKANNCSIFRSIVGELNVVNLMKDKKAFFGGEGNGGVIDPRIHYGRDSIVGIVYMVNLLRRTNKKMSQLAQVLPRYVMKKVKLQNNIDFDKIYTQIINLFPDGKINNENGARIDWKKSWLQLRRSNTEPIIRVIAEAPTAAEVNSLLDKISKVITPSSNI